MTTLMETVEMATLKAIATLREMVEMATLRAIATLREMAEMATLRAIATLREMVELATSRAIAMAIFFVVTDAHFCAFLCEAVTFVDEETVDLTPPNSFPRNGFLTVGAHLTMAIGDDAGFLRFVPVPVALAEAERRHSDLQLT